MSDAATSTITLHAVDGRPLENERVRETVIATAYAVAERQGFHVSKIDAADDRITATLNTNRVTALGFAAELRRLTNNWHRHKFGRNLWGDT